METERGAYSMKMVSGIVSTNDHFFECRVIMKMDCRGMCHILKRREKQS